MQNKLPVWCIIIQKPHSAMTVLISPEMPSTALPSFISRRAVGTLVGLFWDKQHIQKEHIEVMKNVKFGVDQANIEQDTAL